MLTAPSLLLLLACLSFIKADWCWQATWSVQSDCHDDICGKLAPLIKSGATSTLSKCLSLFANPNVTSQLNYLTPETIANHCHSVADTFCRQSLAYYEASMYPYWGCHNLGSICSVPAAAWGTPAVVIPTAASTPSTPPTGIPTGLLQTAVASEIFCWEASYTTQSDCHDDICSRVFPLILQGSTSAEQRCDMLFSGGNNTNITTDQVTLARQLCGGSAFAGCASSIRSYDSNIWSYVGCPTLYTWNCPGSSQPTASISFPGWVFPVMVLLWLGIVP